MSVKERTELKKTTGRIFVDKTTNLRVPIKFTARNVVVENINGTGISAVAYTSLYELIYSVFRGEQKISEKRYLVASKMYLRTNLVKIETPYYLLTVFGVAPVDSIIYVGYYSGTRKHVRYRFHLWFRVKSGARQTGSVEQAKEEYLHAPLVEFETENLEIISKIPSEIELLNVEAEIANMRLIKSEYDPVVLLYYLFLQSKTNEKSTSIYS